MKRQATLIAISAALVIRAVAAGERETLPDYDLSIRIIPDEHRLQVSGTVHLPSAAMKRDRIAFRLRGDMTPSVEITAPANCTGPASLRESGHPTGNEQVKEWEIAAKEPFPAGAPVVINVSYHGGNTVGLNYYIGPEGCFAHGETVWYPQFDEKRGNGRLHFSVPKGFVVKAGGVAGEKRETPAEALFEFSSGWPSYFGFAAGRYTVHRREGPVPVTIYLLSDRPILEEMLSKSLPALQVLENEFGKYPFGEFAIIESPSGPSQQAGFLGAAYEGFYLVRSDFLDARGFDLAHFGHEMGHQWWPLLVKQKGDRGNYMLDEALAQYGSLRCIEELEGPEAAEKYRRGTERLGGARNAVRLIASGFDLPLSTLPDKNDASYELSDSKGYFVFDMLARTIGRQRFQAALKSVTKDRAFDAVSWDELLAAIQRSADKDLRYFFDEWFNRPGLPTITLEWAQPKSDSVSVTLSQQQPSYVLSIPIQVEFADGSAEAHTVQLANERASQTLTVNRRVHSIHLDPHFEVLRATSDAKAEAEALKYFTKGNLLWNHNQTDAALKTFEEGLLHLPQPDSYGTEFILRLYAGWIHQEAGHLDQARHEYDVALSRPIRRLDILAQLYMNYANIAKAQNNSHLLQEAAQNVLAVEVSLGKDTGNSRKARRLLKEPTSQ